MDTATRSSAESREEPGWLGIEEASPFMGKKVIRVAVDAKRWSSLVNTMLVILIMTMSLLVFFASRLGGPMMWIMSVMPSLGPGTGKVTFQSLLLLCFLRRVFF
jgi:xyloglucan fucosyltransferase